MPGDQPDEPGCALLVWQLLGAVVEFAWTILVTPYRTFAGLLCEVWGSRDTLVSGWHRVALAEEGQPTPGPDASVDDTRQQMLDYLRRRSPTVSESDIYAAEGWIVLSGRVGGTVLLLVAMTILVGVVAMTSAYGLPWATRQIEMRGPGMIIPLGLLGGGVFAAVGWLVLGVALIIYTHGPGKWFRSWVVRRVQGELGNQGSDQDE